MILVAFFFFFFNDTLSGQQCPAGGSVYKQLHPLNDAFAVIDSLMETVRVFQIQAVIKKGQYIRL